MKTQSAFTHKTFTGEHGETLYHMPLLADEIGNLADFDATKDDIVTLNYGGTDPVRVLFVKTANRELAEYQWECLDERHNQRLEATRCMVPCKKGGYRICTRDNSCKRCPYGIGEANRTCHTISWDRLISKGYEPEIGVPVETQVLNKIEMEELRDRMNAIDQRIWRAFAMKRVVGVSAKTISEALHISVSRVYQLINQAEEIICQHREEE